MPIEIRRSGCPASNTIDLYFMGAIRDTSFVNLMQMGQTEYKGHQSAYLEYISF